MDLTHLHLTYICSSNCIIRRQMKIHFILIHGCLFEHFFENPMILALSDLLFLFFTPQGEFSTGFQRTLAT